MNGKMLLSAIKGTGTGLLSAAVLAFILNFISLKNSDPDKLLGIFAYAALFLGAAAAGFAAVRFNREKGAASGALSGGIYAIIIAIIAAAWGAGNFKFFPTLLICVGMTAIAALAGIIGLPSEKSGAARRREMIKKSKL